MFGIFGSFVALSAAGFYLAKYFMNVLWTYAGILLWGLYWLGYQVPREWKKFTQEERGSKSQEEEPE